MEAVSTPPANKAKAGTTIALLIQFKMVKKPAEPTATSGKSSSVWWYDIRFQRVVITFTGDVIACVVITTGLYWTYRRW